MSSLTQITVPFHGAELFIVLHNRANGNKNAIIEMWARHNRHFNINSYHELLAVHFDDACTYLQTMDLKAKPVPDPLHRLEDFIENLSKRYSNLTNPIAHAVQCYAGRTVSAVWQ